MTSAVSLLVRVNVDDANAVNQEHVEVAPTAFAPGVAPNGKREPVALAMGNNALSVPTGAKGLVIVPLTGAVTWKLKGDNADVGIIIATTALPLTPILVPLGTTPTIVLNVSDAATAELLWF